MTTFIIISTAIFLLSVIAGAIEGRLDALYGTDPDHKKDFWLRVCIGLPFMILANRFILYRLLFSDGWWLYDKPFVAVVATIFMFVGCGLLYGYFLNITHNKNKNKPLDYIGNTAGLDKLARKLGIKNLNIMMPIGGLMFVLFYYLWTFNAIL